MLGLKEVALAEPTLRNEGHASVHAVPFQGGGQRSARSSFFCSM